ncbi:hypothetical protein U1Q18_009563, partial [Sarracenia purpurea var. burkii]
DLCEDDISSLEKGIGDIFIKENAKPNQVEASNSQHTAAQQSAEAENSENIDLRNG